MPLAVTRTRHPDASSPAGQPLGVSIAIVESRSAIFSGAPLLVFLGSIAAGSIAVVAVTSSLWLVGLIELLILAALYVVFASLKARALQREWLFLDRLQARHCLALADGSIEEWVAPRAFTRVHQASRAVFLRDRDRRRVIGQCLADAERKQLASLLTQYFLGA